MTKNCKECGTLITKETKISIQQWTRKKFCSQPCQWRGKDMSGFVPPLKGKKNPACTGSKHHLWRGGITKEHDKIRRLAQYKEWRKAVFERDDYTCQGCGVRGGDLQADHIKPFAWFPALRFELSNGRTLCVPCHRATPTYGDPARTKRMIDALAEGRSIDEFLETLT